jgi:hypothetical protein
LDVKTPGIPGVALKIAPAVNVGVGEAVGVDVIACSSN